MRPPALPAPKPFAPIFGGLYAAAYGLGGQQLVAQAVRRLGPVVALPVLGYGPVVAVADPALVKQVFAAKPDVLLGGAGVGPAAAIYGRRSMFVQEEPEHLRRRKLLTPPLHGHVLDGYVPIIEEVTRAAMSHWPAGRPMRMLEAARDLTLEVIVRIMFGVEDPEEVARLGAPFDDLGPSQDVGVVHVFRRTSGAWALDAVIAASDAQAGDQFGAGVAMAEGRLFVGVPGVVIAVIGYVARYNMRFGEPAPSPTNTSVVARARIARSTLCGQSPGCCCASRAARPATCGEAIDVPASP